MSLTRRRFLGVGAAVAGAAALSGCESLENHFAKPPPLPAAALPPGPMGKVSEAARLLNRAAFGAASWRHRVRGAHWRGGVS